MTFTIDSAAGFYQLQSGHWAADTARGWAVSVEIFNTGHGPWEEGRSFRDLMWRAPEEGEMASLEAIS